MGLFDKLARVFGGKAEASEDRAMRELETLNKDGRLHSRYLVHGDGVAHVEIEGGYKGVIKDVSYGGMALRFDTPLDGPVVMPNPAKGKLFILDRSIDCLLNPVRFVETATGKINYAGFSLRHEGADTLIFLRDLIEPLRCGKSLVGLDQSMRSERYRSDEWTCLRGDGPSDLLIKSAKDGNAVEALLTFRISDTYCEVSLRNGTIKTGRVIGSNSGPMSVAMQMGSTTEIDRTVLRQGICIMLGAPPSFRKTLSPFLRASLTELKIDYKDIAA